MVDITVTAAAVVQVSGTSEEGVAGATLTAGMALYKDSTDSNKLKGASHDQTAAEADCVGIALHGASSGQPIEYQRAGTITIGATLAVGEVYVVGVAEGGIAPVADPGSGHFTTIIGVATTTGNLLMGIRAAGAAQA